MFPSPSGPCSLVPSISYFTGRAAPSRGHLGGSIALMSRWTFCVARSAGMLPAEAINPSTSMSGSCRARATANAVSIPGSATRITFCAMTPRKRASSVYRPGQAVEKAAGRPGVDRPGGRGHSVPEVRRVPGGDQGCGRVCQNDPPGRDIITSQHRADGRGTADGTIHDQVRNGDRLETEVPGRPLELLDCPIANPADNGRP